MKIETPEAMQALGKRIGVELKVGDVVALIGPLGAGKTELTKGIAAAFGIEEVTSPTFVIARSYRSNPPLIHMDAYRLLAGANPLFELEDLDLDAEKAITLNGRVERVHRAIPYEDASCEFIGVARAQAHMATLADDRSPLRSSRYRN